jgi:circadian clock protein KaiC
MFFSSEESAEQLVRNVGSAGIQLRRHIEAGLLRFETKRPTSFGFEMHLAHMQRELDRFQPSAVIVDPVTSFRGPDSEVHALLLRMMDILKTRGITTIFTSLTSFDERVAQSDFGMSSLMDTWIFLVDIESNGERNRGLYALKSRGMSHSNQIREYLLTSDGVKLVEAYLGVDGVLMGSARLSKEAQERVEAQQQREEVARHRRDIASRRAVTERRIAELNAEIEAQDADAARLIAQEERREIVLETDRAAMGASRGVQGNGQDKSHAAEPMANDTRASV